MAHQKPQPVSPKKTQWRAWHRTDLGRLIFGYTIGDSAEAITCLRDIKRGNRTKTMQNDRETFAQRHARVIAQDAADGETKARADILRQARTDLQAKAKAAILSKAQVKAETERQA